MFWFKIKFVYCWGCFYFCRIAYFFSGLNGSPLWLTFFYPIWSLIWYLIWHGCDFSLSTCCYLPTHSCCQVSQSTRYLEHSVFTMRYFECCVSITGVRFCLTFTLQNPLTTESLHSLDTQQLDLLPACLSAPLQTPQTTNSPASWSPLPDTHLRYTSFWTLCIPIHHNKTVTDNNLGSLGPKSAFVNPNVTHSVS